MRLWHYLLSIILMLFAGFVPSQGQEPYDIISDLSLDDQLIIAADKGDTIAALQLIKGGANVNTVTYDGVTPLMYAAQNGNTPMVKLLMDHGADIGMKPANGYTALISAIRNGQIQTAEYMVRNGADINQSDQYQVTPLMHAIAVDSFNIAEMLLYYNAAVDLKNTQGTNALMLASWLGRYKIAVSLLETGADINSVDEKNWTPLHYSTIAGKTDLMELLIVNGASLEIVTSSGYTPLSLATAMNNYSAARLLTGYGADVNSRINGSLNPLTLALETKNDSLINMLKNQDAKAILRPYFNYYTFGSHIIFNRDDTHLGFSFGLSDTKYNLMTSIGYGFRLKAIQVLEQTAPAEYFQYWEKRHFVSLSLEKAFYMPVKFASIKSGIYTGFSEVLTFGGYRGSKVNPDIRMVFNPRIGGIFEYGFLRFKIDYEFMHLHLREISREWVKISLELLFNRSRGKIKAPSINWL